MEISERKKKILAAVVDEYIANAEPVDIYDDDVFFKRWSSPTPARAASPRRRATGSTSTS